MAAPAYVGAGAGTLATTSTPVTVSKASCTAGNFIIVQVFVDGGGIASTSSVTNIEALDGTDSSLSEFVASGLSSADVGIPDAGNHFLFCGRVMADGTCSVAVADTLGGVDCYMRMYEFSGVHTGTTRQSVVENGAVDFSTLVGLSSIATLGTSTTVDDTSVTTNGPDRLALNFIAINDDNDAELTAMTGETGGDWTYPVTAYGSATGTDGAIGLVTATMASAGTIGGGTDTITSDSWGTIGFALIPPATTPLSPPFQAQVRPTVYQL